MAREPRIKYEGALYHVITCGNQRQKIFKNKDDYLKYLEVLARYKEQYVFYLLAYFLMSNHAPKIKSDPVSPYVSNNLSFI
jgi:putative transposase